MNWVKDNKFLTGFILVMLIAVGVLGFEVMSASGAYDEALENYNKSSGEYNRLRHLAPYPSRQNLTAYEDQKQDAAKVINAFEADLATKEFPNEPMSPTGFQDKLKASVTAVRAKAAENGILLPDKFYLSFDKYETTPPRDEAAAPLARELKAIEWVVNQFLSHPSSRVQAMPNLTRVDLPEESGVKSRKSGDNNGPGGSGGSNFGGPPKGGPGGAFGGSSGASRRDLVKYSPFDVSVICKPEALRETLTTITNSKAPQFYVLRLLRIHNQKDKGPPRASADPASGEKVPLVNYIVGEEWIEATARFEVVDFTPPGEKANKPGGKSSPGKSSSDPKSAQTPPSL